MQRKPRKRKKTHDLGVHLLKEVALHDESIDKKLVSAASEHVDSDKGREEDTKGLTRDLARIFVELDMFNGPDGVNAPGLIRLRKGTAPLDALESDILSSDSSWSECVRSVLEKLGNKK